MIGDMELPFQVTSVPVALLAVAFASSLVDGHRIQPLSLMPRKLHNSVSGSDDSFIDDIPISVQSEQRYDYNESLLNSSSVQTFGILLEPAYEHVAHVASLIQEDASIAHTLESAFHKISLASSQGASEDYSQKSTESMPNVLLGILIGSGMVAMVCCGCCVARRLASHLPGNVARIQHIHDGRVVYEWNQSATVATIYIRPPNGVKKHDLDIRIASQHLRVGRKGRPAFLMEETCDVVNRARSSWSLRNNGELQIFLHKVRSVEWPCVLLHNNTSGAFGQVSVPNSKSKHQARKQQEKCFENQDMYGAKQPLYPSEGTT